MAKCNLNDNSLIVGDLQSLIDSAEQMMTDKNWQEAALRWGYILDRFVDPPMGAFVRLARTYSMLRNYDLASEVLERCLKKFPGYGPASDFVNVVNSEKSARYILKVLNLTEEKRFSHNIFNDSYRYSEVNNFELIVVTNGVEETGTLLIEHLNEEIVSVRGQFESVLGSSDKILQFRIRLNILSTTRVGFENGGKRCWIWSISASKILQVLSGIDDWLFLANDTNRSVDIFTGKYLVSEKNLNEWTIYLDNIQQIAKNVKLCLLIAPSKEQVCNQFYLQPRGIITAIDQVTSIMGFKELDGIYPLNILRQPGTYYKTDTHWSDYGAYLALKECLSQWGISFDTNILEFNSMMSTGDLGSKTNPLQTDSRLVAAWRGDTQPTQVFWNQFAVSGSIMEYENPSARINKKVIIFGDSFSTNMMNIVIHLFSRVVRFYSPASPIVEVIEIEKPDYVILQIAERFIVNSPAVYSTFKESSTSHKISSLNPADRSLLQKKIMNFGTKSIYASFMLRELQS